VKTILFLCTGNYYRSRFAEELFNHHAELAGLDWVAQSRGLALKRGAHNVGPISPFALHALKETVITPRGADRFPRQCTVDDLSGGAGGARACLFLKALTRAAGAILCFL
jgi:protein-tyrosine phosphatase